MEMIKSKIQELQKSIVEICARVNRTPEEITIVAATKYAKVGAINEAIAAGIQVVGENRVQDAKEKFPFLLPVRKHFIGHLQQNKVKTAVELFDCIESVDSYELALKIDQACEKINKKMPIYLEVNIAGDFKKFGLSPEKTLSCVRQISELKNIEVIGFMTIVPFFTNPEETRPYFKQMKGLFDICAHEFDTLRILSMGMSHDHSIAIEEGTNEIRIGSFIFK